MGLMGMLTSNCAYDRPLTISPGFHARARRIIEPLTRTVAPLATEGSLSVGSCPLVVTRMVAPGVEHETVTSRGAVKAPPGGLKSGTRTVSSAVTRAGGMWNVSVPSPSCPHELSPHVQTVPSDLR